MFALWKLIVRGEFDAVVDIAVVYSGVFFLAHFLK